MSIQSDTARLTLLEAQAQDLNDEIRRLRTAIVEAVEPGTVLTVAGEPRYRVMPGRRTFAEALARQVLNADTLAAASVLKVDSGKVKAIAGRVTWELCCNVGEPFLQAVK